MYPNTIEPTRLLPRQTRLIHASEGMRLQVVKGRFWLTQPNATQDFFLGPGDTIDLLQDWVLISADTELKSSMESFDNYSAYLLVPLVQRAPWPATWALMRRLGYRLGRWLGSSAAITF
jgi:hypothetical protein